MITKNFTAAEIEFNDWIRIGLEKGWCGPPVCYTHDALPTSQEEDDAWSEGDDPCMHIIRLDENEEHMEQVKENHSPSVWRDRFKG
jgi:hypothetical protein